MASGTGKRKKATIRTGTIKRTIKIKAPKERVWKEISDIAGLSAWVAGVRKTEYLSGRKRRGVGAVRLITFDDKSQIEEHVVSWKSGEQFSYIATEGLPLRAYVATISLRTAGQKGATTEMTWQSYLSSKEMTARQFLDFVASMGGVYAESLKSLKGMIEGSGGSRRRRPRTP